MTAEKITRSIRGKDQRAMKIAALTDIGSCRQENQDNYCARQLTD